MRCVAIILFCVISSRCLAQDALPFKPKDDFEVKIDMQFKPRPADDPNTVHLSQTQARKTSHDLLPYLKLRLTMFKLDPEEVRYRVENNFDRRAVSKKISKSPILDIDAGFTDDIKAELKPSEYTITLMNNAKTDISKILIRIERDGTFLVNGEKRGKF